MWFPNTLVIKNTKLKIQTGYDQHEKLIRLLNKTFDKTLKCLQRI